MNETFDAWDRHRTELAKAQENLVSLERSIKRWDSLAVASVVIGLSFIPVAFWAYWGFKELPFLGQFGDFLGGTSGIFFSLAAFLYLVATLKGQQKQFAYVAIQQSQNDWNLHRQNRDQKFFVLTENLRGVVNRLTIPSVSGHSIAGFECIAYLSRVLSNIEKRPHLDREKALQAFWIDHTSLLSGYFHQCERIIDFIGTCNKPLSGEFADLFLTHLSRDERFLLANVDHARFPDAATYFQSEEQLIPAK